MKLVNADKLLKSLPDDLKYKASVKRVLIQADNVLEDLKRFLNILWQEIDEEHKDEEDYLWSNEAVKLYTKNIVEFLEGENDEDSGLGEEG